MHVNYHAWEQAGPKRSWLRDHHFIDGRRQGTGVGNPTQAQVGCSLTRGRQGRARAADWLEANSSFELLVQGDAPKAELIDRFVKAGNAVLLGTASFWEGVDVRGEALSLVVIDKLPFASPGVHHVEIVYRASGRAARGRPGIPGRA